MEAELRREARPADAPGIPDEGIPIDVPGPAPVTVAPKELAVVSRCPYCRDELRADRADWVACEGCLARHHASCWREHGSCASCHGRQALVRPGKASRPAAVVALVLAIVAGVTSIVALKNYVERIKLQASIHSNAPIPSAPPATAPVTAPAPGAATLDRDIAIARARGQVNIVRGWIEKDPHLSDDFRAAGAKRLVEGARGLLDNGVADEGERAKRAAECLLEFRDCSEVLRILGPRTPPPQESR